MEFIKVHSWFEEKYKASSDSRYITFKTALNILKQRKHDPVIVETGTTRLENDWGAGSSTILFGDYLKHYGGKLYTVDILSEAIETCKRVTAEFKNQIEYIVSDSLVFLQNFKEEIDLLYLDSVDFPLDGSDPTFCQKHQLKELELALPQMSKKGIILLDDNDFPNGGKTRFSKEHLKDSGATCLIDSQQSLWIL